ncbi:Bug family tripartite tricarboxylate transporter substrate binding protein [Cupriavidus sp. 2MCAB6]|uniref:Bug family tripartite tricarboxylate transporter substrate binding protein n=1 Tax=Cupriavidus sp. 2MCAB6 TaxID=3232981 RepID=UPI003F8ED7A7
MKHKVLLATLLLTLATSASAARSYPTKPVTIVVPFAPGGGVDIITRAVGAKLAERWKQPVVIENKAGAGSAIGAAQVARAPADGYTLLATVNQSIVGNRFLYKRLGYDPDKDFDPLTLMVKANQLIVANGSLPVSSLKDVVRLSREKPGSLFYGSYGKGSQPHLLFATIADHEKIDITHVAYNGVSQNLTALAGGEVALASASSGVIAPLVQAGKIKPIAVAGDKRVARFPDVPTVAEQGFPYAKISIWYALFAPAGTPAAVSDQIRADVRDILRDPAFIEQYLKPRDLEVVASDGKQLRAVIAEEVQSTAAMIKTAGVAAE